MLRNFYFFQAEGPEGAYAPDLYDDVMNQQQGSNSTPQVVVKYFNFSVSFCSDFEFCVCHLHIV